MQLLVKLFLNEKELNKRVKAIKLYEKTDILSIDNLDRCPYDRTSLQYFEYGLIDLSGKFTQEITDHSLFGK